MNSSYAQLAGAMILVGSSVVAGKLMVQDFPIYFASMMRFLLATVLLGLWVCRREGFPSLSLRTWAILATQGVCGSFLFTVFLLHGLTLTSPASAGIITSTTPACMVVMGLLFFKERPTPLAGLGTLLAVAGIMCLNFGQPVSDSGVGTSLAGNALVLGAVVFESMFLLLRKFIHEPLSPLAGSMLVSLWGLIFFLPMGVYEMCTLPLPPLTHVSWLVVAYYGLFVTVLAYILWFSGIVRVPAPVAGVFTGLMPLSALVLSALVLHEPLTMAHFAGCGLVLGSIGLLTLPALRKRRAA